MGVVDGFRHDMGGWMALRRPKPDRRGGGWGGVLKIADNACQTVVIDM